MQKTFLLLAVIFFVAVKAIAQDSTSLFNMMEEDSKQADKNRTDYITATFKTTRLINGHSIENAGKGILDLKVSHRFGTLNQGAYQWFGLDNATMRIGLDYGITDRLMAGAGRSTFEKQYDGFVKYKLLRQSKGKTNMPVSVGFVSSVMLKTLKPAANVKDTSRFSDKLFYAFQVIIARKFSENTSLQIVPTIIHDNLVQRAHEHNDIPAIGIGGRQKITKRISINAEYYYVFPGSRLDGTHNSLSMGVDIETGGHVFQLHFTNSTGMTERTFIGETTGQWSKGDIHFGFNISRVFAIGGKKNK